MREVGLGEPSLVLWPERQARSALLVSDLRVIRTEEVFAQNDLMRSLMSGQPQLFPNPEPTVEDAAVVGSSMSGTFSQADAVMQIAELNYQMPGAQVTMNGQIELVGSTYEFHGKVRTEATASQMTTGWKSMLLAPMDKLLKKNGAGVELPIKVTGTRSTYDLRLDFPHDTRAPAKLPTPAK